MNIPTFVWGCVGGGRAHEGGRHTWLHPRHHPGVNIPILVWGVWGGSMKVAVTRGCIPVIIQVV